MSNEQILHHAAEIARHAKAIQELQAPKPDRTLDYIMLNGACRIHHAVASVIDRHVVLWRLEQMSIGIKTEEILARMEPDPFEFWRGTQWTPEQMMTLERRRSEIRFYRRYAARLRNIAAERASIHSGSTLFSFNMIKKSQP